MFDSNARVAELVDALVSNTSDSNIVSVRPRSRVLFTDSHDLLFSISMAAFYILYSPSLDRFYIGSCVNLKSRIQEHLHARYPKSFTSNFGDWEIYLSINELTYPQARAIESHVKRMKSRTYIYNLKKYQEISESLKTRYAIKK